MLSDIFCWHVNHKLHHFSKTVSVHFGFCFLMWFCGSISVPWTNKHVDKSLFLSLFMFLFLVLSLSLFRISLSLIYLFVSSNSVVLSCRSVCLSVSSYFTLNWNWPSILPFFSFSFSFCCSILSFLSHFTLLGYINVLYLCLLFLLSTLCSFLFLSLCIYFCRPAVFLDVCKSVNP